MINIGLYRSTTNKWVFGVCGGLGEHLGVNPLWIRVALMAICVIPAGLGFLPTVPIYVALGLLLPKDTERGVISR